MGTNESRVADFTGRISSQQAIGDGPPPEPARVIMSDRRLVLAGDEGDKVIIPLANVVDIMGGKVPAEYRDLFEATITVAYRSADDGQIYSWLIESNQETIEKFRTVLFKTLLNGTTARLRHPARVGGRVTDSDPRKAKINVKPQLLRFATPNDFVTIDLTTVIDFSRRDDGDDSTPPSLLVRYTNDGHPASSVIRVPSGRELSLVGRFLRIEYRQLLEEIGDISLTNHHKRLLVAIYTTGGDIDYTSVIPGEAARTTNLMADLSQKGLIDETPSGAELTSHGQVAVANCIEDVNI